MKFVCAAWTTERSINCFFSIIWTLEPEVQYSLLYICVLKWTRRGEARDREKFGQLV